MRVAIVSSLLHSSYGGPSSVVRMHSNALLSKADVSVYGCFPPELGIENETMYPNCELFPEIWPRRWFRGKGLYNRLRDEASRQDIFHAHMLWDHPTWAVWRIALALGKPFVVTPHGSLSALWRTDSLHKKLYRLLVLNDLLRDIGALHVLNNSEAEACRKWGVKARIEVIPNALPSSEYERYRSPGLALDRWPKLKERRILLYMGRLWSQKGLDILPEAFAKARISDEWLLVLAGPDYRGYQRVLQDSIKALDIENRVIITGAVNGELKDSLFASGDCFVLPSHSEGFSMAILEAMAARLPVIMTSTCNFPELARNGGGWEIPLNKADLITTIEKVCNSEPSVLRSMGEKANELGKAVYTSEKVADALYKLYQSLL